MVGSCNEGSRSLKRRQMQDEVFVSTKGAPAMHCLVCVDKFVVRSLASTEATYFRHERNFTFFVPEPPDNELSIAFCDR